jgi:TetR/AcrR family transcriptional regulator, lmrAB and yxaGH operons repressor
MTTLGDECLVDCYIPNDLYNKPGGATVALPRIDDAELAQKLAIVFRNRGYEGASLALIANETGLEKASLYHRFPGGKEEMAAAALAYVGNGFVTAVIKPLGGPGEPAEKLRLAQRGLRDFYQDGELPCALDTLSLPPATDAVREGLRNAYTVWVEAFAGLAREAGSSAGAAKRRAQRAVGLIEGALVISRVTGETKPFRQAISELPGVLLERDEALVS